MTTSKSGAPLAVAAAALLALSALLGQRGSKSLQPGVTFEHTLALGTVAKGNTQPVRDLLLRHGFRWLPAADSWYIPGTRRMLASPLNLDALQAEVDAILADSSDSSGSNVLEFELRPGRAAPEGPPAHMGDVAFLGPDGSSVSLSTLHGKGGPRMGTSAPYAVGRVGPDVIGYADIPMISVDMFGKAADIGVLVPIARQLAMLAADVNGLVINMAPPGLKRGSEKMVEDQNPSSESLGKRKRLLALVFNFEVEGATDPAVKLREYIQSRHSGGLSAIGSGVKPARALTREEISSLGLIRGKAGSRKLEGWEKIGPMPSGASLHRVSRGLYSPRAPEVYGKALASARLPIYVLLADLPIPRASPSNYQALSYGAAQSLKDELDRRAAELAAQGYTVLVMERPIERELEAALQRKRGDRFRISSMTPFVILHRMFDTMKRASWSRPKIDHCLWLFSHWTDGLFENNEGDDFGRDRTEQEKLEMGSTGVNTWAGRNGLLVPNEAMSDLWAKYVLTGRIEYDENATRDGFPWHPSEQKMRASFAQCLRTLFPELLELARGRVVSINI
jgi:hypothetical protein